MAAPFSARPIARQSGTRSHAVLYPRPGTIRYIRIPPAGELVWRVLAYCARDVTSSGGNDRRGNESTGWDTAPESSVHVPSAAIEPRPPSRSRTRRVCNCVQTERSTWLETVGRGLGFTDETSVVVVNTLSVHSKTYGYCPYRHLLPKGSTVPFKSFCCMNKVRFTQTVDNGKRIDVIISLAKSKIKSLKTEDKLYAFNTDNKPGPVQRPKSFCFSFNSLLCANNNQQ